MKTKTAGMVKLEKEVALMYEILERAERLADDMGKERRRLESIIAKKKSPWWKF